MKFNEFAYTRPNMEAIEEKFDLLLKTFNDAENVEQQNAVIEKVNEARNQFETMQELAAIRHTIDTTDEFYKEEQDFFDENSPVYKGIVMKFYQALVDSKFRSELEQKWGTQLFKIAELTLKTFSPEVVKDLQMENRLSSEYVKLMASAKIPFEGEERNLSEMVPFTVNPDRGMRKRAQEAFYGFMTDNSEELDRLYDELVKVRTTIAKKLGYDNFVELGYARMTRTDYNAADVANFRRQVKQYIVPVATKLRERQEKRIGVDKLKYYDNNFQFKTGNPKPKGDPAWILDRAKDMYNEMSEETAEFFKYMTDHELLDLVAKKGKAGGGYCTYLADHQAPFIFSNFNGTSADIDVLTHEGGHAFQTYS
ncbi:MAG TPA: M3 family oligoendopeptidase, partial [Bacillales bacterium]|nr:M3 family oligoendopeptidase [Bacillales bacterium]